MLNGFLCFSPFLPKNRISTAWNARAAVESAENREECEIIAKDSLTRVKR